MDPLNGIFIKRHALAVAIKHNVGVLYVNADPALRDKIYDVEFSVEDGISTVRVYYNNSLVQIPLVSSLIKFYRYIKACRIGIGLVKEKFGKPDISHIHVLVRTFLPAHFLKVPFVISEQWSGYLPEDGMYRGFFKKLLTKIAVGRASSVITVSESLKRAMLAHGLVNKYSVIPNVVDVNQFSPPAEKPGNEKFMFLTVADMDDRAKNISGTIRTMKELSKVRNDFEYHIIGGGEDLEKMQKLARENNLLDKFVFLHGPKKSVEVSEMMKKANVFVLFSHYDNMPCVMTEALASGLPVVGSAIHGMKEHIKQGLGILVTPGDEGALLKAIQNVMDNPDSFDRDKLRQYALENFSYGSVAEKFDKIYTDALAK